MKKSMWFLFVGMLCMLAMNLYLFYSHVQITNLTCRGSVIIRHDTQTMNVQAIFTLFGDIGQSIINGELIDKEGNAHSVHLSSEFRFKQNGNNLYITNYSVAELPNNTVSISNLKTWLPPYLLFNGVSTNISIYPLSQNSYLITSDEYTHTICEK